MAQRTRARRRGALLALVAVVWGSAVYGLGQPGDYVVGLADVLSVSVIGEAALSGKYTVGSDGEFQFPLIGRVKAAGRSVRTIEVDLRTRLAEGLLKNPQVSVEVAEYRSQRVFVIGEVAKPGPLPLRGSTTLLEALAGAGALTERAGGDLLLLRPAAPTGDTGPVLPGAPGVTVVGRVNIQDLQVGAVSDNSRLMSGDTIFVPRAETIDVIGQVNNPGQYNMEKGLTVLRAISMAGGVTRMGSSGRAKIVRIVDGQKTERAAKLNDLLQPGDTLIVLTRLF
jgi:polysaccharide export outer membrane protein